MAEGLGLLGDHLAQLGPRQRHVVRDLPPRAALLARRHSQRLERGLHNVEALVEDRAHAVREGRRFGSQI